MVKPIVCAALLLAVLAHPAVSVIEDGSIYEDYVDIGDVQPVDVYQGSSTTFSISATNPGNLCYVVLFSNTHAICRRELPYPPWNRRSLISERLLRTR